MSPHAIGVTIVALFITLILIAILAAAASNKRRERSRSEQYAQFAQDAGLTYERKAPRGFRDDWATVLPEIPKQGDVQHLIYGEHQGVSVTLFRHRYVVSTGQSAAVIVHWVFATEVPDWPELHVKRRHALARAFAKRSNVLMEDQDFDRRWVIKTKDPAFARALLAPPVRELMSSRRHAAKSVRENWHVVGGKLCCVVRSNLDVSGVSDELNRLHAMLGAISGERVALAGGRRA